MLNHFQSFSKEKSGFRYYSTINIMAKKKMNVKQIERLMMLGLGIIAAFFLLRQCMAESDPEGRMQPIVSEQTQPTTTVTAPITTVTTPTPTTTVRRDTVVQTQIVTKPTPLFIWIDKLKLRSEPSLSGTLLAELPLNTQVSFQNETSTFKQKIKLDNVEYDERWLKVKTATGQIGWVYGGGIRLYQK
jgi:hypothetical protein